MKRRVSFAVLWLAAAVNGLAAAFIALSSVLGQAADRDVIAFVSNRDGRFGIYLADASTGQTRRLVSGAGDQIPLHEYAPQWSPDGRQIAFTGSLTNTSGVNDSAYNREVFVVNAMGQNLTNLTQHEAYREEPVGWSPDGSQILFLSNRNWYNGRYAARDNTNLFTVDVLTGAVQQIGDFELNDTIPRFSPDGVQIVFAAPGYLKYPGSLPNTDLDAEIFVMNADGSNLHPVTDNDHDDGFPVWSPDGSQIAFLSPPRQVAGIFVMDSDGGSLRHLADGYVGDSVADLASLIWSPDGRYLATVFYLQRYANIVVIEVATGDTRNVTSNPAADYRPAWSPDGARLAFASYRDMNVEIYVIDRDGSNLRRLTNHPADDALPAWWPR